MGIGHTIDTRASDVEAVIELPLVNITKSDVLGALFVHTDNAKELYKDALLKLQTWIINCTEEKARPLVESGCFTETEIDNFKKRSNVISPITLSLYLHWLQWETFANLTVSEKEKLFFEKIPDRFRARYRGNAACRNAREVTAEEEAEKTDERLCIEDDANKRKRMSLAEFLREFGAEVKRELETLDKKE